MDLHVGTMQVHFQAVFHSSCSLAEQLTADSKFLQADKTAFEADAKARATANSSSRYGQQEVCQISGLIINSEETRVRDHKMGRNYRCSTCETTSLLLTAPCMT